MTAQERWGGDRERQTEEALQETGDLQSSVECDQMEDEEGVAVICWVDVTQCNSLYPRLRSLRLLKSLFEILNVRVRL